MQREGTLIWIGRKVIKSEYRKLIVRNNHRRCSIKKGVLDNFAKCTGKHLCQSPFFNKVAGLSLFLVNFWKLLRTVFTEHIRATTSESCDCKSAGTEITRVFSYKQKTHEYSVKNEALFWYSLLVLWIYIRKVFFKNFYQKSLWKTFARVLWPLFA